MRAEDITGGITTDGYNAPRARFDDQVCFDFMKGRCTRGEACSFAHGEGELRGKTRGLSERELFRAEQIRKDYWKNNKVREELNTHRENLVKMRRQAEVFNELSRVKGHITRMTRLPRLAYMEDRLQRELKGMGVDLPGA